jgi:hypothetical protein
MFVGSLTIFQYTQEEFVEKRPIWEHLEEFTPSIEEQIPMDVDVDVTFLEMQVRRPMSAAANERVKYLWTPTEEKAVCKSLH